MCKFLIICGCLLAVAQAGVIGGGLLATAPAALAVQPGAASLPLSAATVALPTISTSSSNIIRGIGPVVTSALAPTLLAPGLTTALAGSGLTTGLSPLGLNGLALNGLGAVKVL
ncbi:uncharacterized protein LOC122405290 isoform X3 [Colletes gigas]|uniref:uncharacterized protein LOC122405290 isoform X3 n=1 Tax=Colletes gigas TaxID=935657 RepID=UPI001C9B1B8F|nr:uncharacterized protein LOC122405290 isoform X3 [Colletes gigas]